MEELFIYLSKCCEIAPAICKTFTLLQDAQTWAKNIELQLERGHALGKETVRQ